MYTSIIHVYIYTHIYIHTRRSHDAFDLIHVLQFGTEASVHAEYLLVDDGSHWKAVEAVGERLP